MKNVIILIYRIQTLFVVTFTRFSFHKVHESVFRRIACPKGKTKNPNRQQFAGIFCAVEAMQPV